MTTPPVAIEVASIPRTSRGLWRDAFRRLMRNGPAIVGMVCIAIFVFGALLAPLFAQYDPTIGAPTVSTNRTAMIPSSDRLPIVPSKPVPVSGTRFTGMPLCVVYK